MWVTEAVIWRCVALALFVLWILALRSITRLSGMVDKSVDAITEATKFCHDLSGTLKKTQEEHQETLARFRSYKALWSVTSQRTVKSDWWNPPTPAGGGPYMDGHGVLKYAANPSLSSAEAGLEKFRKQMAVAQNMVDCKEASSAPSSSGSETAGGSLSSSYCARDIHITQELLEMDEETA